MKYCAHHELDSFLRELPGMIARGGTWEAVGERYRLVDDIIFQVYGIRKHPREKTVDFMQQRIIPNSDCRKKEVLFEMLFDKIVLS